MEMKGAMIEENGEEKTAEDNHQKIESFDDILTHIGEAGRYQWFLFLLMLPFTVAYAFVYFVQYFLTMVPEEYFCKIPEFENTNLTDWEKVNLSIPFKSEIDGETTGYVPYSRCKMYITNYTEVLISGQRPGPDTPIGDCLHGWTFNQTMVPYLSIAAEMEWVCDKTYLGSYAQSIFFMGSMLGGLVFGYIGDHYGRKPALIACNAVGLFSSIGTAFCNSYWSFVLVRFIAGTTFDNTCILYIIVLEYVGPKYRTVAYNMALGLYFAVAASFLPWIAYWVADWKLLCFATAVPLTTVFATPWIVPESARWYLQNGRIPQAMKVIKKIAKFNRKNVPNEVFSEFEKSFKTMKDVSPNSNATVFDLFKRRRLALTTLTLIVNWTMTVFIFDGHVWNMKSMHPDVFVSFSLGALTEVPATIVINFLLDRWGRRWMGFLFMVTCGVFSFLALGMPPGTSAMWLVAIARLGVNVTINITFQQSTELLPTVVRVQGITLIHTIGFLAHCLGPSVIHMANLKPWLPLVLLGSLSFVSAFLTLSLPESMDQQLPDTLDEGNEFGKDQNFWWIPCLSKKVYKSVKKTEH